MAGHVAADTGRTGETAVIFISERTGEDPVGYAAAAQAMEALAARQPGYRGMDHIGSAGDGAAATAVTISYWASEADAIAWRRHPQHRTIREQGRDRWYRRYTLHVTRIGRSYAWQRDG
ncbi:MAG: antibiotic biosynthesis monooxygenase [Pacificimonas sp.]|jgi:heme-degrading monooxygenase HmoA|nr:antibiotic biosynthesis monooxygenase [Pacificimonas sp.]